MTMMAHVRNTLDGYKVADELAAERDALQARVRELEDRLNWLANQTMYCDYGDNEHGAVAWHFHTYTGDKTSIIGGSIDEAIDAARKALHDPRKG